MVSAIHRGVNKRSLTLAPFLAVGHADAATSLMSTRDLWPAFSPAAWFTALCFLAASAFLVLLFALRLRRLNGHLRVQLAEQERVARELNDKLLQSVGGLVLQFQIATERIPQSDPTRQLLEKALHQSDAVLEEARERFVRMGVSSVGTIGLPQAFAALGLELRQEHAADFRVVVNGDPRELDPAVRDQLYRIGREAITNSFQHANAERCETEISYDRAQLRIGFRDDGCGVDAAILKVGRVPGHWGLPGMHERARKIGAHFEVWSRPGVGTEVDLRVPATIAYSSGSNASRWRWLRRLAIGGG